MPLRAFKIHVSESVLADLKHRLALTRWLDEIPDSGWDHGTNLAAHLLRAEILRMPLMLPSLLCQATGS